MLVLRHAGDKRPGQRGSTRSDTIDAHWAVGCAVADRAEVWMSREGPPSAQRTGHRACKPRAATRHLPGTAWPDSPERVNAQLQRPSRFGCLPMLLPERQDV